MQASLNFQRRSVILIFGWSASHDFHLRMSVQSDWKPAVDAQIPQLRKFMEQYKLLFPNARQILVRCQPNVFWTREAVNVWDTPKNLIIWLQG